MSKKLIYDAPVAELLLVRFEENIMSGEGSTNSSFEENADVVDRSGDNWWGN